MAHPAWEICKRILSFGRHDVYHEAMSRYNRGDYQAALGHFARITANKYSRHSLYCNLASFYEAQCRLNLGVLALLSGDYRLSAEHLEASLSCNSGQFKTYHYLGIVYNNLNRYPEARAAMERARELNPRISPDLRHLGMVTFNMGRYAEAARLMTQAIVDNPDWADLRYYLGLCLAVQDRFEEAAVDLEMALSLNPKYTRARLLLALVYGCSGRGVEGAAALEEILGQTPGVQGGRPGPGTRDPEYVEILCRLVLLLRCLQDSEEAALQFKRIVGLRPGREALGRILDEIDGLVPSADSEPRSFKGLEERASRLVAEIAPTHLAITPEFLDVINSFSLSDDRGLFETLVRDYEDQTAKNPRYADRHAYLGVLYAKLGRHDDARAAFNRSLEINPSYAFPRLNLYQVLLTLGELESALEHMTLLEGQGVRRAGLFLDKGRALQALGRQDEAVAAFKEAISLNKRLGQAYWLWSAVAEEAGRLEEAREALRNFLEAAGNMPEAEDFLRRLEELSGT